MPHNNDKARLASQGIDAAVIILKTAFWAIVVIMVARYTRDVLIAFAGHSTSARVSLDLVMKLGADRWLAYMFAVGGMTYGMLERRLRRKNIERMARHSQNLETRIDSGRTSSGLTRDGRTSKEDR